MFFSRWIFSTNHKDIGMLYLIFGVWGGFVGTSFSFLIRSESAQPMGMLNDADVYNSAITAYGIMMMFFFVMPVLIGGFGNWLMPYFLKVSDMAFPRLNNLSFWLLPLSLLLLVSSALVEVGVGAGLINFNYTLLSGFKVSMGLMEVSVCLSMVSLIFSFINLLVSLHSFKSFELVSQFLYFLCVLIIFMFLLVGGFVLVMANSGFSTVIFYLEGGEDFMLWRCVFWVFSQFSLYLSILLVLQSVIFFVKGLWYLIFDSVLYFFICIVGVRLMFVPYLVSSFESFSWVLYGCLLIVVQLFCWHFKSFSITYSVYCCTDFEWCGLCPKGREPDHVVVYNAEGSGSEEVMSSQPRGSVASSSMLTSELSPPIVPRSSSLQVSVLPVRESTYENMLMIGRPMVPSSSEGSEPLYAQMVPLSNKGGKSSQGSSLKSQGLLNILTDRSDSTQSNPSVRLPNTISQVGLTHSSSRTLQEPEPVDTALSGLKTFLDSSS